VVNAGIIKALDDQLVHLVFCDGCSLTGKVFETAYLDEGGGFVVEVRNFTCQAADHHHKSPGDYININLKDVATATRLSAKGS
jgi:hypothetical protein